MMDPWTSELTPSMLTDGLLRAIAEEIGTDNLLKLAVLVGGSTFYMPQAESILRPLRDLKIREEYNGYNIADLPEFGLQRPEASGRAGVQPVRPFLHRAVF